MANNTFDEEKKKLRPIINIIIKKIINNEEIGLRNLETIQNAIDSKHVKPKFFYDENYVLIDSYWFKNRWLLNQVKQEIISRILDFLRSSKYTEYNINLKLLVSLDALNVNMHYVRCSVSSTQLSNSFYEALNYVLQMQIDRK